MPCFKGGRDRAIPQNNMPVFGGVASQPCVENACPSGEEGKLISGYWPIPGRGFDLSLTTSHLIKGYDKGRKHEEETEPCREKRQGESQ